jgi:glucose-1-phosphatase
MKVDLKGIKNIIFDLGGVILNLDMHASLKEFFKLGLIQEVTDSTPGRYYHEVFHRLQTGQVTPDQFHKRIREILSNPGVTDRQIDEAWCAMLKGIPASRIETIRNVKKKYHVYLFSNTNSIHIDRLEKEFLAENGFSFASAFDGLYYSHEIHDAKPSVSSFLKVMDLSGVHPAETLFVDDLKENIEGAEKAGLKTFWLKEGMELNEVFKNATL